MRRNLLILIVFSLLLVSCEGTSWKSSVPTYPVRISIDTRVGPFVHFQADAFTSYVVVNKDGYFLDGQFIQLPSVTDAWGYGGVVAYVSLYGYDAYDLACPYCASKGQRCACVVEGFNALCNECGEEYDLASGYALPQHSISHEALRRLNIINSDGKLTISQKQ